MIKSIPSWIRIPIVFFIIFGISEYVIDSGHQPAFMVFPAVQLFLLLVLFILIAFEAITSALENVMIQKLDAASKERYLAKKKLTYNFAWFKRTYKNLLGSKPLEEEHEIILDHNYDGIRELDNNLPPWWLYGFYISIVFSALYLLRYHVFHGPNQFDELETELAEAKVAIEAYKKNAKDLVDVTTVTLLTDASDLSIGKAIYESNCVACHMADGGGGIGPNLADPYWILGGDIKSVFNTISEGGRSGKGMISWKQQLKPLEMAQVSSYVLSFQGTTPASPKDPEGDLWGESIIETPIETTIDSTQVVTNQE